MRREPSRFEKGLLLRARARGQKWARELVLPLTGSQAHF